MDRKWTHFRDAYRTRFLFRYRDPYTAGGYRVVKKWLSYREERVLGRGLEVEEVRELGATVRRIAAMILLGPDLDANYRDVTSTR